MRNIGLVTVARSDWGIYASVLEAIRAEPELAVRLYVSGAHCSTEFGLDARDIIRGCPEDVERVEMLLSSDSPEGVGKSMGLGVLGFSQSFARCQPDILLVLGDRFDMHAAALAALPFNIPVAHIHGGELTYGAMDESLRHSLTKLSHLHFTATEASARRVIQMGEEPWRVTVSGAPALDAMRGFVPLDDAAMRARFGVELSPPPLLVTYHPVTRAVGDPGALLAALDAAGLPVVVSLPNADTGHRRLRQAFLDRCAARPDWTAVESFGQKGWFTMLSRAAAVVGNSSSGIIEAASFAAPVVNVGARQEGRERGKNVLDAPEETEAILAAVRKAVSPGFKTSLQGMANPYGDGSAGPRIAQVLASRPLDRALVGKRFHEVAFEER